MLKYLKIVILVFAVSGVMPLTHADSTLVYELSGTDGSKTQHTLSISGRWLRLESSPKGKYDYILMDTGRLLMFEVDDQAKSFQVTRMGRFYWPDTPLNHPNFMPIAKKQTVAGIPCQPVHEMTKDKQSIAQHCMSAGGPLGLNAREMITLSRLFMSARRIGFNWPGVATPDERQVSILSQTPDGRKQEYKSVVHRPLVDKLFKIPNDYKRLKPDLPITKDKNTQSVPAEKPATAAPQEQPDVIAAPPVSEEPKPSE